MSTTITILTEKPPTLKEAQTIVGGYVERLVLPDTRIMLMNEDGILRQLPINEDASLLTLPAGGGIGHFIVGNVVILEGAAQKGWK